MKIEREQFNSIYDKLVHDPSLNRDYVYECLLFSLASAEKLNNENTFGKVAPINPVILMLYIIHEYGFILKINGRDKIKEDDELMSKVVSMALDKYFTNDVLSYESSSSISKFDPEISTLQTYLNFVLKVLSKESKKRPKETLVLDILYKSFSMCKAVIGLLEDGFETEAFSTWRTLHESECVLLLLNRYGDHIVQKYLKHIHYMMAFRGIIEDKEKVDAIFVEIKDEMHKLGLKSKDTKKYIEYGWLTAVPNYDQAEQFKFNFRDGVEQLAGLSAYSKIYEMASETAHSSPILIYSRDTFFYNITMINLYESFFRLENIFSSFYQKLTSEESFRRFMGMKKIYYTNLKIIYNYLKNNIN